MKKVRTNLSIGRQVFFPKQDTKIFHGFGPAFLVVALGIGSGEFILWPYLSAHYGFGILWGAFLGISIQLLIIVAVERHTAFLGEDVLFIFSRIFKGAFWWILVSTLIGFGWPGFAAMIAQLLVQGLHLSVSELYISFAVLILAGLILIVGKNAYKNILFVQKINVSILFILIVSLFIYYFDFSTLKNLFAGLVGYGHSYLFIPSGISLITFMGAIAYAGSGGNLLIMNSFYVEKEEKGLVGQRAEGEFIVPDDTQESVNNAKLFTKISWKQNTLFFWGAGIILIILLAYVSYAVLHGHTALPDDFSFLILESKIFAHDIHPLVGKTFIISGALALFGVQLGILDFIGRIAGNKPGIVDDSPQQKKFYHRAVLAMVIFGLSILIAGLSKPDTLIIIGSTINAFSMGVIAFLSYRVESTLLPKHISSKLFKHLLLLASVFYVAFFVYVLVEKFFY